MQHKLSNHSGVGTSFHNTTIKTNVETLINVLGEPQYQNNTGDDKTNYEWVCEDEDENIFTIYDWKENRPISKTEIIEFHLGGKSKLITENALNGLNILSKVFNY